MLGELLGRTLRDSAQMHMTMGFTRSYPAACHSNSEGSSATVCPARSSLSCARGSWKARTAALRTSCRRCDGGDSRPLAVCYIRLELSTGGSSEKPFRTLGTEHDEAFTRNLSVGERYEEVQVLASESPERLEELRERFLRALSDLGGGAEEGRPAMVSEVAEGAGLDPEGNPDDRALSERLAAELVDVGYASAEAGSSGFLVITPEGEQTLRGGAS